MLKILAVLGNGDKQASEQMYTVVGDIMRKADTTSNIGNAILYECICCVSSIHPNPKLLEAAADAISKFLKVFYYTCHEFWLLICKDVYIDTHTCVVCVCVCVHVIADL